MKKILILFFLVTISCGSKKTQTLDTIVINQKSSTIDGIYLKLKNVSNDSRCAKGVECIWAGEVTTQIEVYENTILKEEKTLVFNSRNREENNSWFANFYPNKNIKEISVLPYPENGKSINSKDYIIKIDF